RAKWRRRRRRAWSRDHIAAADKRLRPLTAGSSGFLGSPLEDRDEVEADEVDDSLLLGARPLARKLPAQPTRRSKLRRGLSSSRSMRGGGPGGKQVGGLPGGTPPARFQRRHSAFRIEALHAFLRRHVSMNCVNCCEKSM